MTDKAISALRQELSRDMAIRRLGRKTQHEYICHVKRLADFVGRSADEATAEDVHLYQLRLALIGTGFLFAAEETNRTKLVACSFMQMR